VTPFDREDIYRLASALDDVIDAIEAAADFIVLADVGTLPPLMQDQIALLQRSARETAAAMGRLKTLRDLEPYWIEVNRLENEADRIYRKLLTKLFSGDYDALTMVKLREVADGLEDAADALEHVAHAVETIAVKES
jgi:predicted phosphate transport protein (TIGR00153 family)